MKSFLYSLFFSALIFTNVLAQNKEVETNISDVKEFVGEYIYSSGFVGASYKITADGKFEYNSFSDCCDPVWRESGEILVKENLLHFKLFKKTLNNYDLFDPKQATEAYRKLYGYKGEDIKADEFEKKYDLQIVKWGDRIYLIQPERLYLFAAAVNFGVEPRKNIINPNYLTTRFYLRTGDEKKSVTGKPTLPENWLYYLQDTPIKATVTKLELQDKEQTYTIDKGSVQGIKKGMALVGENIEPDYSDLLWVISVEENSAKVKTFPIFRGKEYQIGNIVVSKINK